MRDDNRSEKGYGLSIIDLYKKEFQFVHRHKHNIIDVTPEDRSLEAFNACFFGAFPKQDNLKYFEQAYKDAFDPKKIKLNAVSLKELYQFGGTSALEIGKAKIEVQYNNHNYDPSLFVLDTDKANDLIDFWNLRIFQRNILPIPLQWLEELSPFCKDLISKSYRPLPGNLNGVMIEATTIFARSITKEKIEKLYKKYLYINEPATARLQTSYPSLWRPSSEHTYRVTRPTLSAKEKSVNVPVNLDKTVIQFETLHVEFVEEDGNNFRWANVVELEDLSYKDQIATTFPCDYKKPSFPKFTRGGDYLLPTTEGLVMFPRYKNIPERWELTDGTTAIKEWFEKK